MSHDHRSSIRLPLDLLARLRWKGQAGDYREAEGRTVNISGNGLFLTVPARLDPETPITFTVIFPPEITNTPIELVGQGRVVRSAQVGEPEGIAAIIDDYQLLAKGFDAPDGLEQLQSGASLKSCHRPESRRRKSAS